MSKKSFLIGFSFLGLSGVIIIIVILGLILTSTLFLAGDEQVTRDTLNTSSSLDAGAFCSTTKEIDYAKWDAAIARAGVLSTKGDKIISMSNELGIDPVLFASIAVHESNWGKSDAAINKNNIGGLMDPATNWSTVKVFPSLDEGIEAMGKTLYNRIIKDGKNTIEKLGSVYAPLGAANDPHHLNENWIPRTKEYAAEFGGLTMNCEVSENTVTTDFDFSKLTDKDVSALRVSIAKTGFKWLGRPYVWSGGRNPSDVAAGNFDCSSFVRWVYAENGIDLGPMGSTSTETLNKKGKAISIKEIKIGDVIFFNTYKRDGHIVIYLGDGKFIGANGDDKTGSISVQNMNSPYWKSVFTGHVRTYIND
ncbi:NlpC/P60 family protein [Viridibacillus sp. NPDC093762]|uniref:C40 family peptidase n=1 Tax=Viridibacillus sp. NPDC093762 TaxID=3390720 RepID=UPI003D06D713